MWPFKRRKRSKVIAKYRIVVDDWLYLTPNNSLSWGIDNAAEFDNIKEAYKAGVEIPHVNVQIIENKNGKVKFIHIEEVHKWGL